MKTKKCEQCGKEFIINRGHTRQRFCSKGCAVKNRFKDDIGLFKNPNSNDFINDYIIGLIVTDGCIREQNNHRTICISLKDENMISMINKLVCPTKKIYKNGDNFQVIWKNDFDIMMLNNYGITPNKTKTVHMPDVKNKWHFIRGVFDGDGCVYKEIIHDRKYGRDYLYTNISFTTGSKNFLDDITYFFDKEDIKYTIHKDIRHNDVYSIRIRRRKSVLLMYENMYKDSDVWKLDRKYNKFEQ